MGKQQEFCFFFKAEYPYLSSLDGHDKSMSTQSPRRCHTNNASLQITKQMSKWAKWVGHPQHLVAYPLHTASQIPPYITWLFVHTIQILMTNKQKKKAHSLLSVSYISGPICTAKVCSISASDWECWAKLVKRLPLPRGAGCAINCPCGSHVNNIYNPTSSVFYLVILVDFI